VYNISDQHGAHELGMGFWRRENLKCGKKYGSAPAARQMFSAYQRAAHRSPFFKTISLRPRAGLGIWLSRRAIEDDRARAWRSAARGHHCVPRIVVRARIISLCCADGFHGAHWRRCGGSSRLHCAFCAAARCAAHSSTAALSMRKSHSATGCCAPGAHFLSETPHALSSTRAQKHDSRFTHTACRSHRSSAALLLALPLTRHSTLRVSGLVHAQRFASAGCRRQHGGSLSQSAPRCFSISSALRA